MQEPAQRSLAGAFAALLAVALAAAPAAACGPDHLRPAFWFVYGPEDRDAFLGGELGVIGRELRAPFLLVVYRHATGLGLDPPSRAALDEYWRGPEPDLWSFGAFRVWKETLAEVAGRRGGVQYPDVARTIERPDGGYGGQYVNCLANAFGKAAETLRDRARRYNSEELAAWVGAQEEVFRNCGGEGAVIPRALAAAASPLAHADRAYQIAAARFYAGDFDGAAADFRAIAADPGSPWSDLGAYLEGRCAIRAATLGRVPLEEGLAYARELLESVLADGDRAAVHRMAERLLGFIDIRLDPDGRRRRLRRRLLAERLASPLRQDLIDYLWLLKRVPRDEHDSFPELDRFVATVRRHHDPAAADLAVRTWRASAASAAREDRGAAPAAGFRPELWLAAALVLADGPASWSAEVLEAAAAVPSDSPLYATVTYHRARHEAAAGDTAAARATVEEGLARLAGRLGPGDRNRFELLAAELAPSLAERIERGLLRPLAYTSYLEARGDHPLATGPLYLRTFVGRRLAADVAVDALNLSSTERLLALLRQDSLEPALRRRLAPVAWTRAALLGQEQLALELAPLAVAAAAAMAPELERYRQAAAGNERLFVAALAILRLPGLRPALRHGFGRMGVQDLWKDSEPAGVEATSYLRDNWWCADPLHGITSETVATLDDASRAEAQTTRDWLQDLPPAPVHLGHTILARAETHPKDPRVPEALHRVVRASRVCPGGDISRVAFQTLHRRYPASAWAQKTPYWY